VAAFAIGSSLFPVNRPAGGALPGAKIFAETKGLSLVPVKRSNPVVRSDSRKRALRLDGLYAGPKMAIAVGLSVDRHGSEQGGRS